MNTALNARAIVNLTIGYRGALPLAEVQDRLQLSDKEMGEAVDLIRERWEEEKKKRTAARLTYQQNSRSSDPNPSKEIMDFIAYA